MDKFFTLEDYKRKENIEGLISYKTSHINAKDYIKDITPAQIDKTSVRANFLTISQYSMGLVSQDSEKVKEVELKVNSNRLYSIARKYSY